MYRDGACVQSVKTVGVVGVCAGWLTSLNDEAAQIIFPREKEKLTDEFAGAARDELLCGCSPGL